MAERAGLTDADLATFPDDKLRRELINGELIVSPAPRLRHHQVVGRLHAALWDHIDAQGGGEVFLGPTDALFSDSDVVEPDMLFVPEARRAILTELADRVEVSRLAEDAYATPEILEPGEVLTYDGLPGLEVDLSRLFAR